MKYEVEHVSFNIYLNTAWDITHALSNSSHKASPRHNWKLLQKFVTFVTIEYGTFVTFSVVRY